MAPTLKSPNIHLDFWSSFQSFSFFLCISLTSSPCSPSLQTSSQLAMVSERGGVQDSKILVSDSGSALKFSGCPGTKTGRKRIELTITTRIQKLFQLSTCYMQYREKPLHPQRWPPCRKFIYTLQDGKNNMMNIFLCLEQFNIQTI